MKKEKESKPSVVEKMQVEYQNAFLLKGEKLQPLITDYKEAEQFNKKKFAEKSFKTEKELRELLAENNETLFGEKTIFIDLSEITEALWEEERILSAFLFDLTDSAKPGFYIVEAILSKETFGELVYRMTRTFSVLRSQENRSKFVDGIIRVIQKNATFRNEFKEYGKQIFDTLHDAVQKNMKILLALDSERAEMQGFMETYTDTWGKMIKPVVFRKLSSKDETIITMVPTFDMLRSGGKKNSEKIKLNEEDHLENVSETVKENFLRIKKELLKADKEIEFRVKKHYISLRKKSNLAFLQLGKKKLSIVIANPEKNMRKKIKHHRTLTLAESVKKFWNGNKDCFTVMIESEEYLGEVISLLKKLVASA